jgi:hypothetical protein
VVVGGKLILTYQGATPVRYVGARFEHEGYAVLHIYNRKQGYELVTVRDSDTGESELVRQPRPLSDLFYLVYEDVPADRSVRYRIVVDGLWTFDPFNPQRHRDLRSGVWFSEFRRPHAGQGAETLVESVDGRLYRFTYHASPGSRVAVVGDFNGWDPFMHQLQELTGGYFQTLVRMPPGTHWYSFVVDGLWADDPTNPAWRRDEYDRLVYSLSVEREPARRRAISLHHD